MISLTIPALVLDDGLSKKVQVKSAETDGLDIMTEQYENYLVNCLKEEGDIEDLETMVAFCNFYSPIPDDFEVEEREKIKDMAYIKKEGEENLKATVYKMINSLNEKSMGASISHVSSSNFWTESSEGFVRITIMPKTGNIAKYLKK